MIMTEPKAGVTILAHDAGEAARITALMKGKHGLKGTTVRVAEPEEFISWADKVGHWQED